MRNYIIRRLLASVLILWIISVAVFVMLRIAPTDPAILLLGFSATPESIEAVHEQTGLNDPWHEQYFDWLGDVLTGDLGHSIFTGEDVATELKERLPATLELVILTFATTIIIGIPLGVVSAVYRNTPLDLGVRFIAILGLSIPTFWIATLVLLVPSEQWGYAPPIGETVSFFDDPWDNLRQFGPPALILGFAAAAALMRLVRSSLLEVLQQDYIRTARAKGLRERVVVFGHAVRNSLIPVVTVLGLQLAGLLGGTVIVETVFTIRGVGSYILTAIVRNDFLVVQSVALYLAATVVILNLIVDLLYAWLDPRIRYS
ncbi:MAG TPA: ABC transporter permease [Dehalococcoidia bacterium]|nr:ABC transporter permease [Dehalococcoidia bacterium]